MEGNNENKNPLGDLFSSIKCYIDLKADEFKLSFAESMAKVFSKIIFFLLVFILIGVICGISAAALSSWLGALIGNRSLGLLATAGIFILLLLVLFLFKDKLFVNAPLRMFLKILFENGKDGKK